MLYSFPVRLLSKLLNLDSIIFSICFCSEGRIVSVLPDEETDSFSEPQVHFAFEIRITTFTVRAVMIVKSYIRSSNFITIS